MVAAPSPPSTRGPTALVRLVATAGGAGLLPRAPGTFGTAVAVPLAWALDRLGNPIYLGVTALLFAVGCWAAGAFCRAVGKHDDQRIVIDEVVGYLLTVAVVERHPGQLLVGFVLFRLFDIWKPSPVRQVDRLVHGGVGVMADDVAAAIYAGAGLWLLDWSGALAWLDRLL